MAAMFWLASCGGAGFAPGPGMEQPQSTPLGQPLPALPTEINGEVSRSASDVMSIDGSAAISSSGGEVNGTTMTITSTPEQMAWALYKVEGLAGRRVTSLVVETMGAELGGQYNVGASNFSEGVWDWLQTGSLPEFQYNLTEEQSRLISQLGNMYFVVAVSGGSGLTITRASVISELETPGNEQLPALPSRPRVSEGLPDRIEVNWTASAGAEFYEVQRRKDTIGDHPWEDMASQPETSFIDTTMELSIEYKYRVRAGNAAGFSAWTQPRSGFAGGPPPNFDEEEDEDIEIEGPITAIDETSLSVAGMTFEIAEFTQFLDDNEMPIGSENFMVGTIVEVEADANGSGGWIALRIELENEDGGDEDIDVEGPITALGESSLTVQGLAFEVVAGTQIEWDDHQPASFSDLEIGMFVKVEGVDNGAGGLNALSIEIEEEDEDEEGEEDELELIGEIEAIGESSITVDGIEIEVTAATEIEYDEGAEVDFEDLRVGMLVEVEAFGSAASGWVAEEIEILEDQHDQGGGGSI